MESFALLKLADSENKLKTINWSIAIFLCTSYCVFRLSLNIYTNFLEETNTNFFISTDIADHMPTLTLFSYDANITNIENLMLIDCKIKRSQYLEHEQCVMENRSRNDCITFNNSLSRFTSENQLVGMHFTFKSNLKEDQYYAVIHYIENLPIDVELNRHAMLFFSEKCSISDTQVNPSTLSYRIVERIIESTAMLFVLTHGVVLTQAYLRKLILKRNITKKFAY
jgi:hypothetical protein